MTGEGKRREGSGRGWGNDDEGNGKWQGPRERRRESPVQFPSRRAESGLVSAEGDGKNATNEWACVWHRPPNGEQARARVSE